jgi:hypothetical protein
MGKIVTINEGAESPIVRLTSQLLASDLVSFFKFIDFTSYDPDIENLGDNGAVRIKPVEELRVSNKKKWIVSCYRDATKYDTKAGLSKAPSVTVTTRKELEDFLLKEAAMLCRLINEMGIAVTVKTVDMKKTIKAFFRTRNNEPLEVSKTTENKKAPSKKKKPNSDVGLVNNETEVDNVPEIKSEDVAENVKEPQMAGIEKSVAVGIKSDAVTTYNPQRVILVKDVDKFGVVETSSDIEEIAKLASSQFITHTISTAENNINLFFTEKAINKMAALLRFQYEDLKPSVQELKSKM